MGGPTKDELLTELKAFGVDADPRQTNAELESMLDEARKRADDRADADGFGAYPGDAVDYVLTAGDARHITRREERFARFVKGVAPFDPRVYSEGDAMYGRVFSSYDDGTADIDLLGSFPRVTLKGVELGDGPGRYQKRG